MFHWIYHAKVAKKIIEIFLIVYVSFIYVSFYSTYRVAEKNTHHFRTTLWPHGIFSENCSNVLV